LRVSAITHNLIIELRENKRSANEICGDDFEQIKVIGRGGFSRVVLARKKDTGRLYALKIMKKSRVFKEKKLKPIMSERNILEMLNHKHPFIIKLHWAFQSVRKTISLS
jgi:serum/glucocorticoid-regulated kinase 2